MSALFLTFEALTLQVGDRVLFADTTWHLRCGEQWAIVGPNGAGKSVLVAALRGRLRPTTGRIVHHFLAGLPGAEDAAFGVFPRGTLAVVSTGELQQLASAATPYAQARWHGSEGDGALTLAGFLERQRVLARHPFEVLDGVETEAAFGARRAAALARFGLEQRTERKLMQLSNGELRKALLVRALLLRPRLLVLDEPFVGLDAGAREALHALLDELVRDGVTLLLVTARPEELPPAITHVLSVEAGRVTAAGPRASALPPSPDAAPAPRARRPAPAHVPRPELSADTTLVDLRHVTVRYGATTVLDDVSFTQRGDESWAILGPNGAGKSTLLSLVLADNPQAYANDVTLFGRRRGTGESIWDIKAKVGWMGAELHALYPRATPCLEVVASGFRHSHGLHRAMTEQERARAAECLADVGLAAQGRVPLGALAHGEQRLVLLARAVVHRPLLLVLDEPCQGLDADHRDLVLSAVDDIVLGGQCRVLFVTHHPTELPRTIDHVLTLRAGRIETSGPRGGGGGVG